MLLGLLAAARAGEARAVLSDAAAAVVVATSVAVAAWAGVTLRQSHRVSLALSRSEIPSRG